MVAGPVVGHRHILDMEINAGHQAVSTACAGAVAPGVTCQQHRNSFDDFSVFLGKMPRKT